MSALAGLRVMIVEDEALIAMMAEDMLDGIGCNVVATPATVRDAYAAFDAHDFDVAMLDVNLNGERSMGLAAALKQRGMPFVFTTGYGSDGVDAEHSEIEVLTKPYSLGELEDALARTAGR